MVKLTEEEIMTAYYRGPKNIMLLIAGLEDVIEQEYEMIQMLNRVLTEQAGALAEEINFIQIQDAKINYLRSKIQELEMLNEEINPIQPIRRNVQNN